MKHWARPQRRRRIPGSHAIPLTGSCSVAAWQTIGATGRYADAENFLSLGLYFAPEDLRMQKNLSVMRAREMLRVQTNFRRVARAIPAQRVSQRRNRQGPPRAIRRRSLSRIGCCIRYARLGFYRRAVEITFAEIPPVNPDQSEPGTVLPQNHPLVVTSELLPGKAGPIRSGGRCRGEAGFRRLTFFQTVRKTSLR